MNGRAIATVYVKELTDTLRDRRTILSTLLIPTIVMPLLMFGAGRIAAGVVARAREEIPSIMVLGGEDSPGVRASLGHSEHFHVIPPSPNWRRLISDKKVRAAVEIPAGFEAGLGSGASSAVSVYEYRGELKSGLAAQQIVHFLDDLRDRTIASRLEARGLSADLVKPFKTRTVNVAPPEKVGGNLIGGVIPYVIILLCFTGAMYPAMDLTAGEKERGTLETLLCSPVGRAELVAGKFLVVLTGSLTAMTCSLISMGASLFLGGMLAGGSGSMVRSAGMAGAPNAELPFLTIDPLGLVGVVGMVLPVAVLFSAVLFTVALFAKSYKEAQSYVAPLIFIVIMPAVAGLLPGVELSGRLALVPILNLTLVCKEMLSGVWNWHYMAIIFVSTAVYAAAALALAVRMFNREDVLFRS